MLVGYGYSYAEYRTQQESFGLWFGEEVQSYNPPQDRRHQLSSTFSVELGKFYLGANWQFGSGLPFTRPAGFDQVLIFNEGLLNVKQDYGTDRILLEKPYNSRLPVFHRLDVSLERDIDIKSVLVNVKVGAINTYDRANIFYYDVFTQNRVDQLPFFPYASFKVEV